MGFGALGFFLAYLQGKPWTEILNEDNRSWGEQLFDGFRYGSIASLCILWLLYNSILEAPRNFFSELIGKFRLNIADMLFLSLCAGVGEEILFRGAIQHWLGIWITAIVFIALHGYLDPSDWRISIYGLLMVVIVAGMGYLFVQSGLVAAMMAHFLIDVAIFVSLSRFNKNLDE